MVEIAPVALVAQGGGNAPGAMVQRAINATRKESLPRLVSAVVVVYAELTQRVHQLVRYWGRSPFVPRSL